MHQLNKTTSRFVLSLVSALGTLMTAGSPLRADEGGLSIWLPGTFGSLAAAPQVPGWSLGTVYIHPSSGGSGDVAAAREFTIGGFNRSAKLDLNLNLAARADLVAVAPTYTFA